ncbi:MAG: ANTAR domain-containing protein [Clostridia bacterium]|nr:ANTAR domain-containing protein [Clostridia bacterium]MDD7700439.1 ANTAR domain-containing protein [Eubacteriales bacterium]MDY2826621.1 ANTAR domain-containing protein [Eubacteriales bacterium]
MELRQTVSAVLVVSSSEKFNTALLPFLPAARYAPVVCVGSVCAARQMLTERSFDMVLINAPLPDEFGARFALDVSTDSDAGVLLFVRSEQYTEVQCKVEGQGIFVLSKPTGPQLLSQTLALLSAARERFRRVQQQAETLSEKMEEMRLCNRAKWLLVDRLKMTEPDAHRYIEKTAMDRCVTRRSVAESIIKTYQ